MTVRLRDRDTIGGEREEPEMNTKSVISLSTGLEDAEKVTVAFLVAVGSAESGRPTLMFLTKEAVRLVTGDTARGTACDGCPPLEDLLRRYAEAGGRFLVCPICFDAKHLDGRPGRAMPRWAAPCRCGSGSAMKQPTRSATEPALGIRAGTGDRRRRTPRRCGPCSPPR